jgi:hypothetical protein
MKQFIGYIAFLLLLNVAAAHAAPRKNTHSILLGETEIRINVYEKAGAGVTFFAPHHNEQLGIRLAKELIDQKGGRLIEILSFDERSSPTRNLRFTLGGKNYRVDPNRIFTDNGRRCNVAAEADAAVKIFAAQLLKLILPPDGKSLRDGERFIVAVHNNTDVDLKPEGAKSGDLTAVAFLKAQIARGSGGADGHGAFHEQADGVFLSNTETDPDNFVFLSSPKYLAHFAQRGLNVVVQKAAAKLQSMQCGIDDGSLSVYAGHNNISYICLEADGVSGTLRQRQMIEAVYELFQFEATGSKPETIAVQK